MLTAPGKHFLEEPVVGLNYHAYWSKLLVLPHFILWGRITNDQRTLAHLAITQRGMMEGVTVWENTLVPYHNHLDIAGHNHAKYLVEKFERLYPCTFLAKEYAPKGAK